MKLNSMRVIYVEYISNCGLSLSVCVIGTDGENFVVEIYVFAIINSMHFIVLCRPSGSCFRAFKFTFSCMFLLLPSKTDEM